MATPQASDITEMKQEAETAVSDVRNYALTRFRAAFPYLKTEALNDILDDISAVERKIVAQDAAMTASKANTCFTDLPAEIRNRIYEFALISDEEIEVQRLRRYDCGSCRLTRATSRPTLLSVNRQVRQEALPVYYGNNTFTATFGPKWLGSHDLFSDAVGTWCSVIGKQQCRMILKLELRFQDTARSSILTKLPMQEVRAFQRSEGLKFHAFFKQPVQKGHVMGLFKLRETGLRNQAVKIFYDDYEPGQWVELRE